jgi:two-component system, cell cycle response regulator DivK
MQVEQRRVLLVSESPDERDMYAESLRRAGYCTLQTDNAADAYRLASELAPRVVVTGIRLGGSDDGFALTRRLKQDEHTSSVRVVILTGNAYPHEREQAESSGCDAFFVKPCLPSTLAREVDRIVADA